MTDDLRKYSDSGRVDDVFSKCAKQEMESIKKEADPMESKPHSIRLDTAQA